MQELQDFAGIAGLRRKSRTVARLTQDESDSSAGEAGRSKKPRSSQQNLSLFCAPRPQQYSYVDNQGFSNAGGTTLTAYFRKSLSFDRGSLKRTDSRSSGHTVDSGHGTQLSPIQTGSPTLFRTPRHSGATLNQHSPGRSSGQTADSGNDTLVLSPIPPGSPTNNCAVHNSEDEMTANGRTPSLTDKSRLGRPPSRASKSS